MFIQVEVLGLNAVGGINQVQMLCAAQAQADPKTRSRFDGMRLKSFEVSKLGY